jgi:hypothetical protein
MIPMVEVSSRLQVTGYNEKGKMKEGGEKLSYSRIHNKDTILYEVYDA